jgi:homocysteine S-methyltransferase
MATITELYKRKGRGPLVAYDVSPPRSGDGGFAEAMAALDADVMCVAYSPGRAVRMDTVAAAATIKWHAKKEAIANISCRDMNKVAVQAHLLGAQALGVENVLVVRGDDFGPKDQGRVKPVNDYRPTELIRAIKEMNAGRDFRGFRLAAPTAFCVGATLDLYKGIEPQVELTRRKVEAGADYFITQSVYDAALADTFVRRYRERAGRGIGAPVFWGIQILTPDGKLFGTLPDAVSRDLARGRPGVEIAIETARRLQAQGADAFYVVPPILKGGERDYASAQQVLAALKPR